jgi:hypothetical protein
MNDKKMIDEIDYLIYRYKTKRNNAKETIEEIKELFK